MYAASKTEVTNGGGEDSRSDGRLTLYWQSYLHCI